MYDRGAISFIGSFLRADKWPFSMIRLALASVDWCFLRAEMPSSFLFAWHVLWELHAVSGNEILPAEQM